MQSSICRDDQCKDLKWYLISYKYSGTIKSFYLAREQEIIILNKSALNDLAQEVESQIKRKDIEILSFTYLCTSSVKNFNK